MAGRNPPGRPKGTPKTGGRQKGTPNKATVMGREFCLGIVNDPEYQQSVRDRIKDGSLPPAIESMLWAYAYGKPKDSVEVSGPNGAALAFTLNLNARDRDV